MKEYLQYIRKLIWSSVKPSARKWFWVIGFIDVIDLIDLNSCYRLVCLSLFIPEEFFEFVGEGLATEVAVL